MAANKITIDNLKSVELKTVCSISIDEKSLKYLSNNNVLKNIDLDNVLNISADIETTKVLFIKKNTLRIKENGHIHEFIILDKDFSSIENKIEKFKTDIKIKWISDFDAKKSNKIEDVSKKYQKVSAKIQTQVNDCKVSIEKVEFNIDKSLNKNIDELESLVSSLVGPIDKKIKLEKDKADFDKFKTEQVKKFEKSSDDTEEISKLLISSIEELNKAVFDESQNLEENKKVFNTLCNLRFDSIKAKREQIRLEKDTAEYNLYAKEKIDSIVSKSTYSDNIKSIIEKCKNEIKAKKFNEKKTLQQNKKQVDDLISELNTSVENQIRLEKLKKNKKKFSNYLASAYNKFKDGNKSVIGTARSVFSKACEAIDKTEFNNEKDLKTNCNEIDKALEKWKKKIDEAAKKDTEEIEKFKSMADDSKENMELIKSKSKTIYNSFLLNPYFVLGLSINATQSQAMMVRDKVEKYNKLKITKALTSEFDLRNIDKPIRDLSTVQSAISSLKDTAQKFFWFNNNEYCKIWESKLIFDWIKDDKYNLDLMLACYFHLLVKDIAFTMTKEWNTFICALNDFYKLSNDEISKKLIEQNRCSEADKGNDIADRFKSLYVEPFLTCLEYLDLSELKKFLQTIDILDGGDPLLDYYTERLIQKSDKIQIKMSNINDDESEDTAADYDFVANLKIVKAIKKFVFDNYDKSYIFTRRIQDIYQQAVINSIIALKDNDREKEAIKLAKEIYKKSNSDLKQKLRNTFGYDKLGVPESDLTAIEMHDMGAKYYNGEGVRKNIYTAFSWYKKAADAGFGKSMLVVALCYLKGDGCSASRSMAKLYLIKALGAGETDAIALLKSLEIPHEHYDLGYVYIGFNETKFVEVELSYIGYVRVLDDYNYDKYKEGDNYDYYGGRQTQNPCRIKIPFSGHWHCVIDNDGDDLGGIKSYSCYTRTITNSYY